MLLEAPFTEDKIRALKVGDKVEISGLIFTGRDAVHKYLHDGGKPPVDLNNSIIYHCGPVVVKEKGKWVVKAAGPTTSIREEPYQGPLMEQYGIRAVIGKGGMAGNTLKACGEQPAVYLHAIGGAASYIAQSVKEVIGVYKLDFGVPEAMWVIRVEDFPVVVTMDSHGTSLHTTIQAQSKEVLSGLIG